MEPPPAVVKRGRGPTSIRSVILSVVGSTRTTTLFSVLTAQIAPSSPRTATKDPEGTSISAIFVLVFGSIFERTPLASLSIQIWSELAARPPSLAAGPTGIVARTSLVFISTRERVLSVQFGTQMLPNAASSPEHGRLPTATVATTLLVAASSL